MVSVETLVSMECPLELEPGREVLFVVNVREGGVIVVPCWQTAASERTCVIEETPHAQEVVMLCFKLIFVILAS